MRRTVGKRTPKTFDGLERLGLVNRQSSLVTAILLVIANAGGRELQRSLRSQTV